MKKIYLVSLLFFSALPINAQKTENIFIITLDGLRWQELYAGADSLLIDDSGYVEDPEALTKQFWHDSPHRRREMLMPFFWSVIVDEGQLYGNRTIGNKVNCTNQMWFSYPGYNEILSGAADDQRIDSNNKIPNPNVTVLEYLNGIPKFTGKVAAFCSWDVFPYIINETRSGVYVNAGFDLADDSVLTERELLLNQMITQVRSPWGSVRLDAFTHHYAVEYIKKHQPRIVYISYGETDDFAHDGRYDQYLYSARQTDQFIGDLWNYVQSLDMYHNKTTFLITTDHGRGTHPKKSWKSHGIDVEGAGEIWLAVLGPDTPASGEMRSEGQYYQNQVASTVASFLGLDFKNDESIGGKVSGMFRK